MVDTAESAFLMVAAAGAVGVVVVAWVVFRPKRRRRARPAPRHSLECTSRFAAPLADDAAWGSLPDPAAERALDVRLRKARQLPWQDPYDAPWDRP